VKGPDLDPVAMLRESREYFARSYESQNKIAARVGVTPSTVSCWLAGKWRLKPTTLTKLRAFLDVEGSERLPAMESSQLNRSAT
jgi:transcriptional regulator with XRE-family HTH domain